jgi:pimeloyl-ACP methyl ester carboxylesterase
MASRNPNRPSQRSQRPIVEEPVRRSSRQPVGELEVVDPAWLLKALLITVVVAALFGYLAVCLLVYQGGWQLLLHPSAKIDAIPAAAYETIHFDAAATGKPQLTGWWIPAESPTSTTPTILFLHDGSGSLSAYVSRLDLLHRASVNIFAIDYRGFGQSDPPHPTEARMAEDSTAALTYLIETRHISDSSIVPYGQGIAVVFAAGLIDAHPELPAVIIDTPDTEAFDRATSDTKARLLPMSLLVQEHFDAAPSLTAIHRPKLLLADAEPNTDADRVAKNQSLFSSLSDPKMTVTFGQASSDTAYIQSIKRFLDEYVGGK